MSFLACHEKIVQWRRRSEACKRKRFGRLRAASSCADLRAWSLDPKKRNDYLIDTLNEATSSEDISETESIKAQPKEVRSEDNIAQDKDVENLRSKLINADGEIEKLKAANISLEKTKSDCTIELDNLRSLVKDLQEQMVYCEYLKTENAHLRSEVGSDVQNQLLKAEDEISHLQRELDIFHEIKIKYGELRQSHDTLKCEHNALNRTLAALKEDKSKLAYEFSAQKEELFGWKSRAQDISTAVCEKNLLKEKLHTKEKQICQLYQSIDEQEIRIEELNCHLERVTSEFEHKQRSMLKHIEDLQGHISLKNAKLADLQSRLDMTERVVEQLEALREQFRLTNADLTENVSVYKKQFMDVLNSSNKMVEMVARLQKELEEKEEALEKANLYPSTPKTLVYFTQINNVIESSKQSIGKEDPQEMKDTLLTIKTIINNLKRDMWGTCDISMIAEFSNSIVQTEFLKEDNGTQVEVNNNDIFVQTEKDEYAVKYEEAQKEIDRMTEINNSLEEHNQQVKSVNVSLEEKVTEISEQLEAKEAVVVLLKNGNNKLCERIVTLNEKLKNSDDLLHNALIQLEIDSEVRQAIDEQFETLLKSTIIEYDTYVQVLESCLDYKQNNLDIACKLLEKQDISSEEVEEVKKLKQEVEHLTNHLEKEKVKSCEQRDKMCFLLNDLFKKSIQTEPVPEVQLSKNIDDTYNEIDIKLTMVVNHYKQEMTAQLEIKENLAKEQKSKKQLKKFLQINSRQRDTMRQKIIQMNVNMKRVKKIIHGLRNRLGLSEKLIEELQVISDLLSSENNCLKRNNTDLIEEIGGLKIKILNLETSLRTQEANLGMSTQTKKKMEKVIVSLMKKLAKYKHLFDKNKATKGTMTNEHYLKNVAQKDHLNTEIDALKTENLALFTTITKLKDQVTTLFDIPQKENKNVELQVSFKDELDDEEKELLFKNVKSHYEAILKALHAEHSTEKDQSQKQYLVNLKMLKDTYERDMNALKNVHAENLAKLQTLHDEEMINLKESRSEEREKQEEEKLFLKQTHKEELEAMTSKFELLMSQKSDLYKDEKEMLMAQLSKTVIEKNCQIERLNSDMLTNFKRFKNKCKISIKNMKDRHRVELENLVVKCKSEVRNFILREEEAKKNAQREKQVQCLVEYADKETYTTPDPQVVMSDKYTEIREFDEYNAHRPLSELNLEEEILTDLKRNNINTYSVRQAFGGSLKSNSLTVGDTTIDLVQDPSIYIEHIARLEAELALHKRELVLKASSYEKMIRWEQMKASEFKHQYDQELEHSVRVHCRLGAQYNKAEELELENKALSKRLSQCESRLKEMENDLEKERDKTQSMKSELAKLKTESKGSYELEMSLNRLKKKIEQAVQCEKRLNEELKKEKESPTKAELVGQVTTKTEVEEKIILIQTCGIVQYEAQI